MTFDRVALGNKQSIFVILNKLLFSDVKPVPLCCIWLQSSVANFFFFFGFYVLFFSLFKRKILFPCTLFLVVPLCCSDNKMRLPTGLNYVVCT